MVDLFLKHNLSYFRECWAIRDSQIAMELKTHFKSELVHTFFVNIYIQLNDVLNKYIR